MSIEDDVKNAIEEFGTRAHERFTHKGMAFYDEDCRSNDFLLSMLSVDNIKIKPLPELFAHGVSVYGDDEYLMWEISLADKNNFVSATDNNDIRWSFDSMNYDQRRKTSASREFNLDEAKDGAVCEVLNPDCTWITCKYLYEYTDKRVVMMIGSLSEVVKKEDLRMKYLPKKVQS